MTLKNPYIEPYDYFQGYEDSINKLKNRPELVEFDKLCYELFHGSEIGRNFMNQIEEKYLLPSLANINSSNYQIQCIWAEGFKSAFRMIKASIISHDQRIKAEKGNKA